jgi:hypothetical protein
VLIDLKKARRFRELEQAADIEPGSVIDGLLSGFDAYEQSTGELVKYIEDGWELTDPAATITSVRVLSGKWHEEDAAEEAERAATETDGDQEEKAARLARIIEVDRPAQ